MKEFIALMAFLMALIALSIDAMLPALEQISSDLGVTRANNIQYIVSFIFMGMALGTIVYGPLADAIGRKPALFLGLFLFLCGSVISWTAQSLTVMLIGRFIQGVGVGAPRVITMAIVRDKFHGREMASVMSLIMGFFIFFPAVAPAIGQGILYVTTWQGIFIFYILLGIIAFLWAHFRLDETLSEENRRPLNIAKLSAGIKEAVTTRVTLGYTVCSGFVFGCLLAYINSAQQIFYDIFAAQKMFPIYFGVLALAIGAAFFANSGMVGRFGMRKITASALLVMIFFAALLFVHTLFFAPSLIFFMICACPIFFSLGLTFGNMGAMALEPMGHMAGLASAFMGAFSTIISLSVGVMFGQLYNGTLLPLSSGFLILGILGFVIMLWTEKGIPREHPENKTV